MPSAFRRIDTGGLALRGVMPCLWFSARGRYSSLIRQFRGGVAHPDSRSQSSISGICRVGTRSPRFDGDPSVTRRQRALFETRQLTRMASMKTPAGICPISSATAFISRCLWLFSSLGWAKQNFQ